MSFFGGGYPSSGYGSPMAGGYGGAPYSNYGYPGGGYNQGGFLGQISQWSNTLNQANALMQNPTAFAANYAMSRFLGGGAGGFGQPYGGGFGAQPYGGGFGGQPYGGYGAQPYGQFGGAGYYY